ncbi:MAG: SWIM zinc finger family protein [Planctomycetota bacterium]|jgi:uncharacterized Zn finger protein
MAPADVKASTDMVTPPLLRRMAGERNFVRGEAYFATGAVRSLRAHDGGVKAVVQGTRRYRVHLWAEDGELGYDCSCPVGHEGEFCKHCVAVGLAWHAGGVKGGAGVSEEDGSAFGEADLRAYLLRLDKDEFVSLLLEHADEDERLHRRLTLQAARATSGAAHSSAWTDALAEALENDTFVDYREAYDYACGVEEVIETLEDFLRDGEAAKVVGLAEHGVAEVERSLEHVDDSDGWLGGLLGRLQELHLEACRQARPEPVELAERLFEAEMESSFDAFHRAALVYGDVIGEAGLAAYRRLAEAEWAKVPALGPGEDDPNRYGQRFRITSIMEALARQDGDLEALVAVKSRDLSLPYAFLEIAKLYQEARHPERALDWAERGWRAFSGRRRDERLRAFLADAYQDRGRRDEAMALVWEAFVEDPSLETYRQLHRHGRRANEWADWRDKALALIRTRNTDRKADPPDRPVWMGSRLRDGSLLVEIFLYEGDGEAAWREAQAGGCSEGLWLELAKRREKTHPEDAVGIYKAHVARLLRNTGARVYEEAVGTLEKIRAILARCGQDAAFQAFVIEIRATQRRKRNLIKMLDAKGW